MATNNIIDTLNDYLLDAETFSNEFLPLRNTLSPIKKDLEEALDELKQKSQQSEELSDKVFYINRYTDLVKKVESIFEARGKRLQQTLQTLAKLAPKISEDGDATINDSDTALTPEQCNKILQIISNGGANNENGKE